MSTVWLSALVVAAGAFLGGPVQADPVLSSGPAPAPYDIEARVRNGNTGFEAVLFTPGDPSPGTAPTQLNPSGAPIWNNGGNSYGDPFNFLFTYTAATGTATWGIDFTRDGDFSDSEELATSVSPTLAGKSFKYLNLFGQGNDTVFAQLTSFVLNGFSFGPYATTSTTQAFSQLFENSTGLFGDITATGTFTFTGSGGQERPRIWLQLGSAEDVAAIPEPATFLSGLIVVAAGLGLRARRRCRA